MRGRLVVTFVGTVVCTVVESVGGDAVVVVDRTVVEI